MEKKKLSRKFVKLGVTTGIVFPFLSSSMLGCNSKTKDKEESIPDEIKKLKILVLGGTSFLGLHQIAY